MAWTAAQSERRQKYIAYWRGFLAHKGKLQKCLTYLQEANFASPENYAFVVKTIKEDIANLEQQITLIKELIRGL
jgi:hypothetical protein